MIEKKLLIFGSGGHAKVVIYTAQSCKRKAIELFDEDSDRHGRERLGFLIEGGLSDCSQALSNGSTELIVAVGNNCIRERLYKLFDSQPFATLTHPASTIASDVHIGKGTVIFAGGIVHPGASIGNNVIINTGSIVDHDCIVRDHAQIAPGARLCGNVVIDEGAMICAGATVIPGVKVGKNAVVAAGAVVTSDISDGVLVAGVPAVLKRERSYA